MVGEVGRGRRRGVLPVANPPLIPCPDRCKGIWTSHETCAKCGVALSGEGEGRYTRHHPDQGLVTGRLLFAEVGQTKAGKPKFIARDSATTDDTIIVVFETMIGFRGGNSHTGDRIGWKCQKLGCDAGCDGAVDAPETCPKCGAFDSAALVFSKFPGEVLARGYIAQGGRVEWGAASKSWRSCPKM
jgi:hypothetical protein